MSCWGHLCTRQQQVKHLFLEHSCLANAAKLVRQACKATCLVNDAVYFPFFHGLLDALSCLHHRLRDLLRSSGGKTEDVIFRRRRKRRRQQRHTVGLSHYNTATQHTTLSVTCKQSEQYFYGQRDSHTVNKTPNPRATEGRLLIPSTTLNWFICQKQKHHRESLFSPPSPFPGSELSWLVSASPSSSAGCCLFTSFCASTTFSSCSTIRSLSSDVLGNVGLSKPNHVPKPLNILWEIRRRLAWKIREKTTEAALGLYANRNWTDRMSSSLSVWVQVVGGVTATQRSAGGVMPSGALRIRV